MAKPMLPTTIGVYWGPRAATADECVVTLRGHFEVLASASPKLSVWYRQGKQKPSANDAVDTSSSAELRQLVLRGQNRADHSGELLPELGFRVSAWNGDSGGWSASSSVTCGLHANAHGLSNGAFVTIDFGPAEPMSAGNMLQLLRGLVEVWKPDEGFVYQLKDVPFIGDHAPPAQRNIYATYFNRMPVISHPRGKVERLGGGALWIDTSLSEDFAATS